MENSDQTQDFFTCVDCSRELEAEEAAYDVRQDGELAGGTICLDCADSDARLMVLWPSREIA